MYLLGTIKLCDFGSATTDVYSPNPSWSANQRNMLEENVSIEISTHFVLLS